MAKLDVAHWGPERLRVNAWRADPTIAQLTPSPGTRPNPETIERCVAQLADQGYRAVLTSALTHTELAPFEASGFTLRERLRLLARPTGPVPGDEAPTRRPATTRIRRGRRRDRDAVLAVDAAAFNPFWRFDAAGLRDARTATPSSRYRVAHDQTVVGYAITGRAGTIGYLQRLAVRPDQQRQGIGRELVRDALEWVRRRGASTLLVNTQESNTRALQLYTALGFVEQQHGLAVLERPLLPDHQDPR